MTTTLPSINALLHDSMQAYHNLDLAFLIKLGVYIAIGIFITFYLSHLIGKLLERNVSTHHAHILRRIVFYAGIALSFLLPLSAAGIDVTGLLSAAGVVAGIATAGIAFGAQTSVSNFLSGVFLLIEKPFKVGHIIQTNNATGEVLSIDLLSVKIRTSDNVFVRVPNEQLLKSQLQNLSSFPIRRFDLSIQVSFDQDLEKLKQILFEIARQNPLCLVSPEPEFHILEFKQATICIRFSVWSKQSSLLSLKTALQLEIQSAFNQFDIQLP